VSAGERRRIVRRRAWVAVAAAFAIHALLLGVMGLIRPQFEPIGRDDRQAVELQLLPPLAELTPRLAGARPRQARLVAPAPAPPGSPLSGFATPAGAVVVPAPSQPPSADQAASEAFPGFFNGAQPGCGLEDVALLTADEKVRCRNRIEAARARRAAAADDAERAGRIAAMRALPKVDGIAPAKRAYYDAVVAAERLARDKSAAWEPLDGKRMVDFLASSKIVKPDIHDTVGCALKFGANKGKPARPRYALKLGPFDCPLAPPPGFLTEEAGVSPP
jgi:hypothetical protein